MRAYRRLRDRPGSYVTLAANYPYYERVRGKADAFVPSGAPEVIFVAAVPTLTPMEQLLAHESLHQVVDRNVGPAASAGVDRMHSLHGMAFYIDVEPSEARRRAAARYGKDSDFYRSVVRFSELKRVSLPRS